MTERHVDLTELLEKLGIKFNLKIDKENMIIIISLDNSNKEKTVTDIKEPKKDNVMGSVLRENSESLNYEFLDVASSLCEKDSCFTVKDGQPVYTDKGHFSKVGADIVGSHIFNKLMN